jgi:hypothetical protein
LRGKTLPVRLVAGFLAACWAWVGWAFHLERYATINWAATHFGAAFIAEAILLAVLAAFARGERLVAARRDVAFRTGAGMLLTALAYPAIGWAAGRDLVQSQAFGMAPDPTAIGTLGLLCCLRRPSRWLLGVIPVLWCLVNGAMLWAMDAPEAWLLLAAPALVAVEVARTTARRRQASAAGGSEPSG